MHHLIDENLLPDFSAMRARASWPYTLQNYIETRGTFELAVAFAELFWPTFVEREGCILRADVFSEERFQQWWAESSGDRRVVECAMNLLHVEDLIPSDTTPLAAEVYGHLAEAIAQMWRARVQLVFPHRRVVVQCSTKQGGPTIQLFQDGGRS
jgi:hypothetical protein